MQKIQIHNTDNQKSGLMDLDMLMPKTYYQSEPSNIWTVNHYKSRYVSAETYNSDGARIYGTEQNISTDTVTIKFKKAITGYTIIT